MLSQPISVDHYPLALCLTHHGCQYPDHGQARDTTARAFVPTENHKCPEIATADSRRSGWNLHHEGERGCVMANAGIGSILVTSPISTRDSTGGNAIATEQLSYYS